ncbi:MAG: serine/threonine protein kinase [Sandaracinus sp.]|nr:serine/threonine protein kinase [Sandaracinus sp.]MCB9611441.1 serine/threonine protein kinase [Sandaracinus sp.]
MSVELGQQDPLIGHTIADRFVIQSRVGSGGMGSVYRAMQLGLERDVALKLLKEEVSWDPDTITRFHREAKAMSLLVHPNTVRVFDFGQTYDGTLYLAMELLEGEMVTKRLEREGALSPTEVIRIGSQILSSLHEAHAKGIVHRDLKPDNIFLASVEGHAEPVVKVLDFGIAKVFEGENRFDQLETQAGTVFGTPRYMSPEQAQGKPLDPRSDLYSVGVLLYQLLAGVAPFRDEDAVVVMAKHIREKPQALVKVAPTRRIPSSLDQVVLRALEKQPDKRWQDAEQFRMALEGCLPDADGRRNSHTGIFWRAQLATRERWPWLAAGGVLLLGVALAVAFWPSGETPEIGTGPEVTVDPLDLVVEANAAPEIGTAELDSDPTGAEVYHEGRYIGSTPLTWELPMSERMTVEVRRDGFESATSSLIPGEPQLVILHRPLPQNDEPVATRRRPPRSTAPAMTEPEVAPTMAPDDPYTRFM